MNKKQILQRINDILADERLAYESADISTNIPLALIQLSMEVELHTLQKVLGIKLTNFKELRELENFY